MNIGGKESDSKTVTRERYYYRGDGYQTQGEVISTCYMCA